MLVIASLLALLAVIFMFFEQICSGVAWVAGWVINIVIGLINLIMTGLLLLGTFINNLIAFIVNLVAGVIMWIIALAGNCIKGIGNLLAGLGSLISAFCHNIGVWFSSAWHEALASFWDFIADCLEGLDWLAKPIEAIAKLFGKSFDYNSFVGSIRDKASANRQLASGELIDPKQAWNEGFHTYQYADLGDAWSTGWNTMDRINYSDAINTGMNAVDYVDPNAWANSAGDWASGIKGSINDWGKQFQKTDGTTKDILLESKRGNELLSKIDKLNADGSTLNNLSNLLNGNEDPAGRRFPKENLLAGGKTPSYSDTFPKASDPKYDVSDAYKIPTNDELLAGIKGNTDDINDKLDWSDDELKYLRELAHQGWTNKFTTASIKVDMSNYNTVNSELDMDGIVTRLRDGLVEEMNIVANGVYE